MTKREYGRGASGGVPAALRAVRLSFMAAAFAALASPAHSQNTEMILPLKWPVRVAVASNVVRATGEFTVEVEDANRAFDVGTTILLFDISSQFYVGIVRDEFGKANKLVAVPRTSGSGEGTAWLTNEKQIVFGRRTRSCPGIISIRKNETMSLLRETGAAYDVMIERYGRQMRIDLPKNGVLCSVEPAPEPVVESPPPKPVVTNVPAVVAVNTTIVSRVATAKPPAKATAHVAKRPPPVDVRVPSLVIGKEDEPALMPQLTVEQNGGQKPPTKPVISPLAVTAQPPVVVKAAPLVAKAPPERPASVVTAAVVKTDVVPVVPAKREEPTNRIAAALSPPPPVLATAVVHVATAIMTRVDTTNIAVTTTPLVVSTATVAVVAPPPAIVPVASNAKPVVAQAQVSTNAAAGTNRVVQIPVQPATTSKSLFFNIWTIIILVVTVGAETGLLVVLYRRKRLNIEIKLPPLVKSAKAPERDTSGDISGNLEKFPLNQLVQFFHASKESGTLAIAGEKGVEARLIFEKGQIIDADSTSNHGLPAAEVILRRKKGLFRFRSEDNSMRARTIHQDTLSMLMQVMREDDEAAQIDMDIAADEDEDEK